VSNTRRRFLTQASALAAATSATFGALNSALAKAPLGGGTAVSTHRMKLGSFEITTLLDGFIDLNPAILLGDPSVIKSHLEAAQLWGSPIRTAVNAFMVNTGEKLILVDCGGAKMLGPTAGRVPQGLAQLGIDPGMIDEVYITHAHGDHLHGAVTPEGAKLFPNAILRISKPEIEYWGSPTVEAAAPADQKGRFAAAKRAIAAYGDKLQPFDIGSELTPGIRSVDATGHTPGHSCYMVTSGTAKLLLLGDTLHVAPVQFPRPEITVGFDYSRDDARAKRLALFQMAARENILVAAVHLPGIGRLREKEGAFTYEPLPWQLF
jgi:glyoxylase-like metal-dependent hydrolase (beta-lactamase superfamily II)